MHNLSKSRLVRISGINYGLSFAIDFIVAALIARLLTPVEIGTFSVAMASIVLVQIARTAGVNIYIIQARELGPRQVAAALGLAMLASAVLGILVVLASGPIAAFYDAPQMGDVLRISALGFLFVPLQSVATGLLMRGLRVGTAAACSLAGSVVGACITLTLAWRGFGPVALAFGALGNVITAAVLGSWATRETLFVRPSLSGWRGVLSVSGWVVGGAAINQLGGRLNELVVGRSLGLDHAAMLDRAEMLPRMVWSYVAPALLAILTPLIASELRTGADARVLLVERIRYFSLIFVPIMVGMAAEGDHLILTIFGAQWVEAIPSVFWLCLNGAIAGQAVVIGSVLVAMGRTRAVFFLSVCEQGMRAVVLVILCRTDITTIARAMVVVGIVYAAAAVTAAMRAGVLRLRDLPSAIGPSLLAGLAIYGAAMAWRAAAAQWMPMTPAAALVTAIAVLAATWLSVMWILEPKLVKFGVKVAFGR